jgi:hypothetical protein
VTVGSIVGGGFRLIREHPGAVAVWALLYLAATVLMTLAMQPMVGAAMPAAGGGGAAALPDLSGIIGRLFLVELVFFVLVIVLLAASQRAVLHPERSRLAYLRLGMDELRLLGLALILLVIFYAGMMVAAILLTLLVGIVAVAAGPAAAMPLFVVEMLILLGLILWFQVRLSLAFPLTLLRGKIVIGEAWRATRSAFWTLFGAFLVIFLILLVLWIGAALVSNGGYLADLAQTGFTPEGLQQASERQMARQFGGISATTVIGWIVASAAGAFGLALFGGAVATAARELTTDVQGLAETFA